MACHPALEVIRVIPELGLDINLLVTLLQLLHERSWGSRAIKHQSTRHSSKELVNIFVGVPDRQEPNSDLIWNQG